MARLFGDVQRIDSPRGNIATLEVHCPYCGGIAATRFVRTYAKTFPEFVESIQGEIFYCFDNPKCFDKPIIIEGRWANRHVKGQAQESGYTESYPAVSGL